MLYIDYLLFYSIIVDCSCEYEDWDMIPNSLVDGYLPFPFSEKTQNRVTFVPICHTSEDCPPSILLCVIFLWQLLISII